MYLASILQTTAATQTNSGASVVAQERFRLLAMIVYEFVIASSFGQKSTNTIDTSNSTQHAFAIIHRGVKKNSFTLKEPTGTRMGQRRERKRCGVNDVDNDAAVVARWYKFLSG